MDNDHLSAFGNWVEFTWQRYYQNQGTQDLPDIIAHADVHNSWPRYRSSLISNMLSGEYRPGLVQVVDLPKDKLTVRPLARLQLRDRLIYEALTFSIAERIDREIPRSVYSYRWSTLKGDLRKPISAWMKMRRNARRLHNKYPKNLLAKTDVTSFYEHVELDVLMDDLYSLEISEWTRYYLESFLATFQRMNHIWGIPQGSDASGVLANLYLLPVDRSLRRNGIKNLRYSDDIMMFGNDWEGLRRELLNVNRIMRGRRLSLAGTKTRIIPPERVSAELDDGDKDAIRYGLEVGLPSAYGELRELFNAATAQDPPIIRDLRFALNQLIRLDDDYALPWIAENFPTYPHIAPDAIRYLERFHSESRSDVGDLLGDLLTSRKFINYPYAEHYIFCFLLRSEIYRKSAYEAAWRILSNRNEEGFLRESAVRYVGRYARPGDTALLKQEFRREQSVAVRRVLLVALHESKHIDNDWLDASAEALPELAWTCEYLKTNPKVPYPAIKGL
ncbi:reverse transcriptase domain-containing protein [Nonomuraea muscovyensis]